MSASRLTDRKPPGRPSGLGPHTVPILWMLQGWMAMFFLAASYAKLTEPIELLALLMVWPAMVSAETVRVVGWVELILGVAILGPLVSSRRLARYVALTAVSILMLNAAGMTVFYFVRFDPGLAITNMALLLLGVGILHGHRTTVRP